MVKRHLLNWFLAMFVPSGILYREKFPACIRHLNIYLDTVWFVRKCRPERILCQSFDKRCGTACGKALLREEPWPQKCS